MRSKTFIDIAGLMFGRLMVLEFSHTDKHNQPYWKCQCGCDKKTIKTIRGSSLRYGTTVSCGCFGAENSSLIHTIEHKLIRNIEHKRCGRCKQWTEATNFYKDKSQKDSLNSWCVQCRQKYRKNYKSYFAEWAKNKSKSDVNFRLKGNLRHRIWGALKKNTKSKKTEELLGCSIECLIKHLESQFSKGMSWENYGSYWHVDHIVPCANFDLSNTEHQKRCFSFSNLQPLTVMENLRKGASYGNV